VAAVGINFTGADKIRGRLSNVEFLGVKTCQTPMNQRKLFTTIKGDSFKKKC